jgi:heme-degrading monooxygenase HmoA
VILEIALLDVRGGREREFEVAFAQVAPIIASMPGYCSHRLERCIETPNRYALLVEWTSLEAHTVGSAASPNTGGGRRCSSTSTFRFRSSSITSRS